MNIIATIVLATSVLSAQEQPAPVGFFPITIKAGTNVVERLPLLPTMLPKLIDIEWARKGDLILWSGKAATFDGKTWQGKDIENAHLPVHEKIIIIRKGKETDVWNIGGQLDMSKIPSK